jgi:hypothetical protein
MVDFTYEWSCDVSDMLGKTLTTIKRERDEDNLEVLIFKTSSNETYKMFYDPD